MVLTQELAAILNGTMYIYGGRSKTSESQTTDTWSMCPHPAETLTASHTNRRC